MGKGREEREMGNTSISKETEAWLGIILMVEKEKRKETHEGKEENTATLFFFSSSETDRQTDSDAPSARE